MFNNRILRASLSRLRQFATSTSAPAEIPPELLEILNAKSSIEDPRSKTKKRILILSPEETKNKAFSRYVAKVARKPGRSDKQSVIHRIHNLDDSSKIPASSYELDVSASIENFRPDVNGNSSKSVVGSIVKNLASSFTKPQLAQYVQTHVPSSYRKSFTKTKLSEIIATQVWNQNSSVSINDVFMREQIPLSRQEMFLLLSQRGSILRLLKSTVSSLDFDVSKNELVLTGTENQIQNAKINLEHKFEHAYREKFDLTSIQALYEEKFGSFTFEDIGRLIEVHFRHLQGEKYELCALNPNQVKRIKRLLVWYLDFNLHRSTGLFLPEPEELRKTALVPHLDDYGMTWKNRSRYHFRLIDDSSYSLPNLVLQRELRKLADDKLKISELNIESDNSPMDSMEPPAYNDDALDIMRSLGLLSDKQEPEITEQQDGLLGFPQETSDGETSVAPSSSVQSGNLLSIEKRDLIFNNLTNFQYRRDLSGLPDAQLDKPIFTVTLGRVLFSKDKTEDIFATSAPDKSELVKNYTFSTNVPVVYDNVLAKALADENQTGLEQDPHVYNLQFKLLPSPYSDSGDISDLKERMKYPPVEIWVQLNKNLTPDLETLQIASVEGENVSYVCLPQCASDLKITCQITGQVLDEEPLEPATDKPVDIEGLFESTSSKYPKLKNQKGVQKFLEESNLDFRGSTRSSIAPFVDIVIDNKPVRYSFVSLNYRRELEVMLNEDQMAQVSIVDGGSLGGRSAEVTFVGDYTKGLGREAFDRLLDYTCKFIKDL